MRPSQIILRVSLTAMIAAVPVVATAQQPGRGAASRPPAQIQTQTQTQTQTHTPEPDAKRAPSSIDPDGSRMKWLLNAWAKQSEKLKTLAVSIYRVDRDFRWKDEVHYEGSAYFQSPGLAYLDFSRLKLAENDKKQLVPVPDPKKPGARLKTHTETIICSNDAVWQYLYEGKQIYVFPLAKGERQRALDEGPLPFLFNMKADEAESRYAMTLDKENANFYLVRVIPKLQGDRETFKMALLTLDKKFLLPAQIALISPDGKSTRVFYLDNQRPNKPIDEKYFKGGVYKNWQVVRNPTAEMPRQGNAGPRPDAPARR